LRCIQRRDCLTLVSPPPPPTFFFFAAPARVRCLAVTLEEVKQLDGAATHFTLGRHTRHAWSKRARRQLRRRRGPVPLLREGQVEVVRELLEVGG
jgi:hypothetical protein